MSERGRPSSADTEPSGVPRHLRRDESAVGRVDRRGPTIVVKLGALLGILVVTVVVVSAILFGQLRTVARDYDSLLATEVQQGFQAREMQVEFKKQVQEWKNILLRGFVREDLEKYSGQFRAETATVIELSDGLSASVQDPGIRAELEQFRTEHRELIDAYEAALGPFVAAGATDPTVPDRAVRGLDRPPTDRIDTVVGLLEASIADQIAVQKADLETRQQVLLTAGVVVLAVALGVVVVFVGGIVRPIRRLTRDAFRAAHDTLPAAVAQIRSSPTGADPPIVPAVDVRSSDELRDLGRAVSTMQASAVRLAMEQHRSERESAEILVNLGRRNQNLLSRTLSYITALERTEQDPEVLAQLFQLDHATTRIRRNAESMLVIAGANQTRTWSHPVSVNEVVRAALSEVEDYTRVDIHHLDDVRVTGSAVADLVHLIAELVENATHFSPPHARVTIVGQHAVQGYRVRVVDHGVGMTSRELDEANLRIARAPEARTDTKLLGLYVVGRLAARRGIEVILEPTAGRGITANVGLPAVLLSQPAGREPVVVSSARDNHTTSQVRHLSPVPAPRTAVPSPTVGDGESPLQRPLVVAAGPASIAAVVPRRVRGAQLPDLGPEGDGERRFAAPDTDQLRGRLYSLQAGLRAARARQGAVPVPGESDHRANGSEEPS